MQVLIDAQKAKLVCKDTTNLTFPHQQCRQSTYGWRYSTVHFVFNLGRLLLLGRWANALCQLLQKVALCWNHHRLYRPDGRHTHQLSCNMHKHHITRMPSEECCNGLRGTKPPSTTRPGMCQCRTMILQGLLQGCMSERVPTPFFVV